LAFGVWPRAAAAPCHDASPNSQGACGTRDTVGISAGTSPASIQRAVQRYPKGAPAFCYVNASSPSESALRRGNLWLLLFGLIPLVFIAVGVGGIIAVWRAKPASALAVSERFRRGKVGVRWRALAFHGKGAAHRETHDLARRARGGDLPPWQEHHDGSDRLCEHRAIRFRGPCAIRQRQHERGNPARFDPHVLGTEQ